MSEASLLLSVDELVRQMGHYLAVGEGAYFLGSGASVPSGLPDFYGLMTDVARSLGIELRNDDDFPQIAQYAINADNGNRAPLFGRIQRLLRHGPRRAVNPYHECIARTNVSTIWTTNFDTLLETRLGRDVSIRSSDSDLLNGTNYSKIELLKVHGCIDRSPPDGIVVTKGDYEDFSYTRPAFAQRLRHDLTHRSMLFIGHSYRDPSITTVAVEARRLGQGNIREHFMIVKDATDGEERQRQLLWLRDLRRFGIRAASVKDHDVTQNALERLARASRGSCVYVTGSHRRSPDRARDLGRLLADKMHVVLLDGQSEGTGREALKAFGAACIDNRSDLIGRLRYFTNPYGFDPSLSDDASKLPILKDLRSHLFRAAQVVVVFDGRMGTEAEVEVACEMGCVLVPVPEESDGIASRLLRMDRVRKSLPPWYVDASERGAVSANEIAACVEQCLER